MYIYIYIYPISKTHQYPGNRVQRRGMGGALWRDLPKAQEAGADPRVPSDLSHPDRMILYGGTQFTCGDLLQMHAP